MFEAIALFLTELFIYGSVAIVCFYAISILVFAFTGQSLLWRICKWNRENKEPEPLSEEELREANQRAFENLDDFGKENVRAFFCRHAYLRRFKNEYERGLYPRDIHVEIKKHPYELVNPMPYLLAGDVDDIVIYHMCPDEAWEGTYTLLPWFAIPTDEKLLVFDLAYVNKYNIWSLLLKGMYEKPRFKTIVKAVQCRTWD